MTAPLIQFENVTVARSGRVALDALNLSIDANENIAILGPNGCGKSTMVKAIAGDLRPYAGRGRIRIAGRNRWNLFELRKTLGVVSNELQVLCSKEVTALDLVVSGFFGSYGELRPYEVTEEQQLMAAAALFAVDAGHLVDRQTCELSSGEGRRALIARALVNNPGTLLLDEPTTSLDLKSAHLLVTSLRKIADSGTNVALVTHHVEEIFPEIRRVVLLRQGKVFLDGPTEAVMTSENLSELFDANISLERHCGVYRARLEEIP
jgi:iron complex transport system ATP-binding protein